MTAKKHQSHCQDAGPKAAKPTAESSAVADEARIMSSNLTLHELFQQQTSSMFDRADLSEEQKQSILIGMSCPAAAPAAFRSRRS